MVIHFRCDLDGSEYHADEAHGGQQLRCLKCGRILTVPYDVDAVLANQRRVGATSSQAIPRTRPRQSRTPVIIAVVIAVGLMASLIWLHIGKSQSTSSEREPFTPVHESSPPRTTSPDGAAALPSVPSPRTRSAFFVGEGAYSIADIAPVDPHIRATTAAYRKLPNGTLIVPRTEGRGLGVLEIQNGTVQDATARLIDARTFRTSRWVYISAGQSVTLREIVAGRYRLLFVTGLDWDEESKVFAVAAFYKEFDDDFVFRESGEDDGVRSYSRLTVSLHAVPTGTARTQAISAESFLRGEDL